MRKRLGGWLLCLRAVWMGRRRWRGSGRRRRCGRSIGLDGGVVWRGRGSVLGLSDVVCRGIWVRFGHWSVWGGVWNVAGFLLQIVETCLCNLLVMVNQNLQKRMRGYVRDRAVTQWFVEKWLIKYMDL